MRTIKIRFEDGSEMIYATNDRAGGCFARRPYEGAYHQTAGTMQTPTFTTWQHFRRWLGPLGGRVIETFGWD